MTCPKMNGVFHCNCKVYMKEDEWKVWFAAHRNVAFLEWKSPRKDALAAQNLLMRFHETYLY